MTKFSYESKGSGLEVIYGINDYIIQWRNLKTLSLSLSPFFSICFIVKIGNLDTNYFGYWKIDLTGGSLKRIELKNRDGHGLFKCISFLEADEMKTNLGLCSLCLCPPCPSM
jgi:hypothetical protein